jgi:sec-independent protein translocase protein TatA
MGGIGPWELILIFLVVLLVFGAKRIPEIARGLGRGIREFKSATSDITNELTYTDQPRLNQPQRPVVGQPEPREGVYQAPAGQQPPPVSEPHPQAPAGDEAGRTA